MHMFSKVVGTLSVIAPGFALLALPHYAASAQQSTNAEPIPAYHAKPPQGELPATMQPSIYSEYLVFNAYTVAGRIKKVLYQQPCYCHCDRSSGHGSLLDCFVSRHGTGCGICQKEVFYSYEQTHRGRTPAQIREGIIRGDWQKVDLAKYDESALPPLDTPNR